ncbi:hypothetical protein [Mesorhizobium sp.]|nr:hypothetical protein [Mesorhizobium sp.]
MPRYHVQYRDLETDELQHELDFDDLEDAVLLLIPSAQYLRVTVN